MLKFPIKQLATRVSSAKDKLSIWFLLLRRLETIKVQPFAADLCRINIRPAQYYCIETSPILMHRPICRTRTILLNFTFLNSNIRFSFINSSINMQQYRNIYPKSRLTTPRKVKGLKSL